MVIGFETLLIDDGLGKVDILRKGERDERKQK